MTKRRVLVATVTVLAGLVALAWFWLIGTSVVARLDDHVTVLSRKNLTRQIGANVLVYSNGGESLLVDAQLVPLARITRSDVNSVSPQPPDQVVITHWHPDHSGGISAFSSTARVIAHRLAVDRLSSPQQGFGLTKPGSHHTFAGRSAAGLPSHSMDARLELKIGAAAITVVHYPGAHTDGDLVVYFHDSEVAAVGDLIWPGSFPFIDVYNGGTVVGLEAALESLLAESTPNYRFIPGHGATVNVDTVQEYLHMIRRTREWVEEQHKAGLSLDKIIETGLPREWSHWSSPLVPSSAWIEIIHSSQVSLSNQ